MVSFRNLVLAASAVIGATAAPTEIVDRQTFTPGKANTTQEFYVTLHTTNPHLAKYNGWAIETYHTGAGLADPVFAPKGTPAFLNNTQLQFDVGNYPFSVIANVGDTNYARWEPVTIGIGYGTTGFVNSEQGGLQTDNPEFGGFIVCEWYHGINAPQLFQLIKGFADQPTNLPSSCGSADLRTKYI